MNRPSAMLALFDKIAEWSLYILIFVLPFSKSLVEITVVTGILSLAFTKIIRKERFFSEFTKIDIFLYIFLAASLLSLFNTHYMGLSLKAFFSKSLKFAALFLITKEIINTKEKLNNFMIMALLSCGVILIDAFTQYFITHVDFLHDYPAFKFVEGIPSFLGAPTASFPFPNDFAAWILIFIFPTGMLAFSGRGGWLRSALSGFIFICLLYSLFLTKARGAWFSFLIATGFLSYIKLKKLGVVLLIILLLATAVMNKASVQYIAALTGANNERATMWKNGWEIFKEHPIMGNGLNTFYVNYAKIRNDEYKGQKGSYAHNCYLQMAADIGLVGLASFLIFIAAVIIKGSRAVKMVKEPLYRSLVLGINLALIAFLAHSFVDTNLYSLNLTALFWVSLGVLLAIVKISETNT